MAITANPDRAARITGAPPAQVGETLFRAALPIAAESFDAAAFTVRAVVATKTPVPRRDSRGPFMEVLDPAGLRPQPQASSVSDHHRGDVAGHDVPLLSDHEQRARATIGRAFGFAIEDETVTATLRFGQADDVKPLVQRVQDRTLHHVSAGYRVHRWAESVVNGQRTKTAVEWEIMEVSLVPIPADPRASIQLRSAGTMPTEVEHEDLVQTRTEIRTIARAANLPAEWADEQIDAGASPIEARAAAFTALQTRAANRPQIRVTRSHDDPATIQRRASDALTFRAIGGKLAPEAAEYQHLSLLDHARAALDRAGISHRGMSNDEVLHRSLTTSDFPLVVGNVAGKVAGDAYEAAQSALRPLFRAKTLPDFKPSQSVRLTEVGRLEEITEAGEFTNTSRGEAGEGLQLRTFGKRLDLSRKLIINDDLGLFADTTAALGRAAAMTEADAFAELLTGSQALSDGLPLFHASRENTTEAGGALSIEMLSDLRLALRQQKLDDGVTPLSVEPRFLVVSPADETAAEQILAEVRAEAPFQVNPFSGKLQLLVEPRLAPGFIYLVGNPASVPIFNVAYLASARGPQIQRMEAWDTLGVSFRVWLDFGVGFAGWRGIVRAATE